jgi:hypothetical protein
MSLTSNRRSWYIISQVNGNCHISYSCTMDLSTDDCSTVEIEAFNPLKMKLTSIILNESAFNTR